MIEQLLLQRLTSWATTNAHIKRTPGLSRKDQL